MSSNLAEVREQEEPRSEESEVRPRDGKAQMKEWLANLSPPLKAAYEMVKSRDPKGRRNG